MNFVPMIGRCRGEGSQWRNRLLSKSGRFCFGKGKARRERRSEAEGALKIQCEEREAGRVFATVPGSPGSPLAKGNALVNSLPSCGVFHTPRDVG